MFMVTDQCCREDGIEWVRLSLTRTPARDASYVFMLAHFISSASLRELALKGTTPLSLLILTGNAQGVLYAR